jgi:excisionase family DNA binding protein
MNPDGSWGQYVHPVDPCNTVAQGLRPPAIARILQVEGWRSAHGKGFTEGSVRALLARMGVVPTSPKRPSAVVARRTDELTVTEVAARLNLPEGTVYNWLCKGRLPARRVVAAWHTLWLVRLEEVEALLRQRAGAARLPPRSAASS